MKSRTICVMAIAVLVVVTTLRAHSAEIEPGLYMRTTYAFGNLAINTLYIGAGNKIAIDANHGADPFDFDGAAKEDPKRVGTFTVAGNNIMVTWGDGKPAQKLPVEFEKGKLSAYDGGLVTKADAYPKNHVLNATFAGSGMTANVSASRTMTFTPDGKYTMNLLGGVHHIPGNSGVSEKNETGTYSLSGNTLTLTSAGGDVSKHTVIPFSTAFDPAKAKISDEHMIFDGANLKREK